MKAISPKLSTYNKSKSVLNTEIKKYRSHIADLERAKKKGLRSYLGDKLTSANISTHKKELRALIAKRNAL